MKIAFIGIGRLGGALALALARAGHEIEFLVSRRPEKAEKIARLIDSTPRILRVEESENISSDVVFITVPDPQIRPTAASLARKIKARPMVFHTSGALSSDVLSDLRRIGCRTGSVHPLVSVSDAERGASAFKNAYFCVEGDEQAVNVAQEIVADLSGNSFSVEARFKPLYHAAAVVSAGHLTALFSLALEMLAACGLAEDEARKTLLPLAESALKNLASQNPAQALTGTFARADADTLARHLEIMDENASPLALEVYRLLGLRSLDLAAEQGADKLRLEEMRKILTGRKP